MSVSRRRASPSNPARAGRRWSLSLLGGLELRTPTGERRRIRSRKAQALLAYLALPAGRRHTRAKIASLLWSEVDASRVRNNLRQALFVLRRALAPIVLALACDGDVVSLSPTDVDVDVARFERLAAGPTIRHWRRATELYRGDLLDGLDVAGAEPFEEWLAAERLRLRGLALQSFARVLAHDEATASDERAFRTATRLLELDPVQESAHRALMRFHAARGRRAAALEQYQTCVEALQRELRIEPEPETQRLYRDLLPLSSRASRARRRRTSPPAVLPDAAAAAIGTPLVGRAEELAKLESALGKARRGHGRVILISGEAGVGKTRLVEETARRAARNARILFGRCHETERTRPFAVWLDAFRDGGLPDDPRLWRALSPATRVELGRLFPEASERARGDPEDVRRLFEAVVWCLAVMAASQPVVVVLEDLHWADAMSLRLLSFAGRRVPGALLILASAREEGMSDVALLREAFDELDRERRLRRVRLAPLSRQDTHVLVGALTASTRRGPASEAIAERVWTLSKGNPFLATEVARALGGCGEPSRGEELELPEIVHMMIEARLARLETGGGAVPCPSPSKTGRRS